MLNAVQILDKILDFFKNLGEFVIYSAPDGTQPSDLMLALAVGGFFIYLIIAWIRSNLSYEIKLMKSIDRMNNYFFNNPTINNENLKTFNNKMKDVPKPVRDQWQMYMLKRDKEPSEYLSIENCIERPLKYTSYKNNVRNVGIAFDVYMIILSIIICGGILFSPATSTDLAPGIYNCLMVPAIIYILKFIYVIILNIRYSVIMSDIFNGFSIFQRAIDKASVGLPDYIDYEMLFTKKEIKDKIPILQDYIERRERKEKEELEKAKNSEVEHEDFDFKAVGLNASLLLERAMRESETYTNNKKRLLYKIAQKNQELQDYKNNYENLNKEQLRQQQVSKENLERLRHSAETSTNRVEASRIAKQQEEELKRQEQLEKDASLAYDKYLKQKDIIDEEIKALEAELVEKRKYVEDVMMAEFKTYTAKLYDNVTNEVEHKYNAIIDDMKEDNDILSEEIKDKILLLEQNGINAIPTIRYEVKQQRERARETEKQKEQDVLNAQRLKEAMKVNEDSSAEENDVEESLLESPQITQAVDTAEIPVPEIDQEQLKEDLKAEIAGDQEQIKQDLKAEITQDINQEKIKEDLRKQLKEELKDEIKGELNKQQEEDDKRYDAFGGYYDENGNYIYRDGSYYDAKGNYYDAKGNLIMPANKESEVDAYGGHYDEQGNYVYEDGSYYDTQGNYFDAQGNLVPLENMQNDNQNDGDGNYDDNGNYVYSDGSYYDAQGNFHEAQASEEQQADADDDTEAQAMYDEETKSPQNNDEDE